VRIGRSLAFPFPGPPISKGQGVTAHGGSLGVIPRAQGTTVTEKTVQRARTMRFNPSPDRAISRMESWPVPKAMALGGRHDEV